MHILRLHIHIFVESANLTLPISFWKAPIRPTSIDCFVLWCTITTRHALYCIVPSRLIVVPIRPCRLPCSPWQKQSSNYHVEFWNRPQQSTIEHDTTDFIVSTLLTSSTCSIHRLPHTVLAVSITETWLKGMNRLAAAQNQEKWRSSTSIIPDTW